MTWSTDHEERVVQVQAFAYGTERPAAAAGLLRAWANDDLGPLDVGDLVVAYAAAREALEVHTHDESAGQWARAVVVLSRALSMLAT